MMPRMERLEAIAKRHPKPAGWHDGDEPLY
jgi:hypothetical protein